MKAKHPVPNVVAGEAGLDTAECVLGCGRSPQGLIKDFPSCWINRYKLCFGRVGHWLALAGHPKPGVSIAWLCPANLTTIKQELIVFCSEVVIPHSLIFLNSPPWHSSAGSPSPRCSRAASGWHLLLSGVLTQVCSAGLLSVKVAVLKHFSTSQAQRLSCFRDCWSVSEVWCLKSSHRAKVCTGWGCKGSILLSVCHRRAERDILMALNE